MFFVKNIYAIGRFLCWFIVLNMHEAEVLDYHFLNNLSNDDSTVEYTLIRYFNSFYVSLHSPEGKTFSFLICNTNTIELVFRFYDAHLPFFIYYYCIFTQSTLIFLRILLVQSAIN